MRAAKLIIFFTFLGNSLYADTVIQNDMPAIQMINYAQMQENISSDTRCEYMTADGQWLAIKASIKDKKAEFCPVIAKSFRLLLPGSKPNTATDTLIVGFDKGRYKDTIPLINAHSHNDYEHKKPLIEALNNGFCSIEADIYLKDNVLVVSHDEDKIKMDRTLENLYLKPLYNMYLEKKNNSGKLSHQDDYELLLYIDIKEGIEVYHELLVVLKRYREMLTKTENGREITGFVRIIITGNRPVDEILSDNNRYMYLDGRTNEIEKYQEYPQGAVPVIGISASNFKRKSLDTSSENSFAQKYDIDKIRELVAICRKNGYKLRLWTVPNDSSSWSVLINLGVDLINTDNLTGLKNYLLDNSFTIKQ